ncbi:hypothetical protein V6Z11_A04G119800 [Gossypium hirsutum]
MICHHWWKLILNVVGPPICGIVRYQQQTRLHRSGSSQVALGLPQDTDHDIW